MAKFQEDNLQIAVATYLDLLKVLWCHVGNERKTKSKRFGGILRAKGVKSGVPDCIIFEPRDEWCGLALELKVEYHQGYTMDGKLKAKRKSRLSPTQKEWLKHLGDNGWFDAVAYNFDEAKKVIDTYLNEGQSRR